MPQQYTVTVTLPAVPTDEGIVSRRLSRSVDGGPYADDNFGIVETSRQYVVEEGNVVVLRLYHLDAAGNVSAASEQSVTATDLTPPSPPGTMVVELELNTPPVPPPTTKELLVESDFTLLGYFRVSRNLSNSGGADLTYGQGFTHRVVGGQLRFMTFGFMGNIAGIPQYRLVEFAAPPNVGGTVSVATGSWADVWAGGLDWNKNGWWHGLWWDEDSGGLWTGSGIDYPDDASINNTEAMHYRTLNNDGTIAGLRGPFGLAGISQRRLYGGMQRIPQWFQTQYGTGPFAGGWGGYASRMNQGLGISLGPAAYAFNDPRSGPNGSTLQSGDFRTLADHVSGAKFTTDWYANGSPSSFDRGVRNADVINYYDGGDPRQNPQTPPIDQPAPGAQWLSPAPDGLGRWVWGDSAWNTGCWIDTPLKHGFLVVPSLSSGKAYYMTSALNSDRKTFEVQVFDPSRFGEVIGGTRQPWDVKPTSRWQIYLAGFEGHGNGPGGSVAGASFDPVGKRLYLYCPSCPADGYDSRMFVYAVNC